MKRDVHCLPEPKRMMKSKGGYDKTLYKCPEVEHQLQPTPAMPINSHKQVGGQGIPEALESFK